MIQEIIEGNSDVVLIVAHSDGFKLYIGKEEISIEEIRQWNSRTSPVKNRKAVLLVCNAANVKMKTGLIFKRPVESLMELLLNKGYFETILAPDKELAVVEAIEIIRKIKANVPLHEICKSHRSLAAYVTTFEIMDNYLTSK